MRNATTRRGLRREPWLLALALIVLMASGSAAAPFVPPSRPSHLAVLLRAPLVSNCDGGSWRTLHLLVWGSGCEASFGVEYAADFSNWNSSQSYNFSFHLPVVGEVGPAGELVRYADPMNPAAATTAVTTSAGEVNISLQEQINVTSATGGWLPNDSPWGSGPQWSNGTAVLGLMVLSVVFHLVNASNNDPANSSYRVKFDLNVDQWPWADARDALGVGFQALGAGGAHFAYNDSASTLVEAWNSDGTPFVNLTFDPAADVAYPTGPRQTATVSTQSELFPGGTPDRQAVVLLTFGGVPGNYSGLAYDPWVSFAAGPSTGPSPHEPSLFGLPAGGAPAMAFLVAAVGIAAASLTVGWYVRDRRLRRAGEALVSGIEQVISEGPPPRP